MIKSNNFIHCEKNQKGFTLIELLIAVFVFVVIITAVVGALVSSISGYKNAVAVQKDLEDAQFQMNLMAKYIRTSKVVGCLGPNPTNSDDHPFYPDCGSIASSSDVYGVRLYDYSQSECVQYAFIDYSPSTNGDYNEMEVRKKWLDPNSSPETACAVPDVFSAADHADLSAWNVKSFRFFITQSRKDDGTKTGEVGKVLLSLEICPKTGCATDDDKSRIQTIISLRNFDEFSP